MRFLTMLFILCIAFPAALKSQQTEPILERRLSISVQNLPIEQILKLIEKEGAFTIGYSQSSINVSRSVNLSVNDMPVREILSKIFPSGNIAYRVLGNRLLLYANKTDQTSPEYSQTVRGTVIDTESNQPMPGVNVVLRGSDPLIGASTDPYGRFKIENVPVGRHNFVVSFMGYRPKTLPGITVDAGKEVVLNIGLEESVTELGMVVVTDEIDKSRPLNEMVMVSGKSFSVEETSRYAGSFHDPARMATTYAGVVASADDVENSIIIRGNSPKGLLWRLEGMEIPNPNHFGTDGASSGAISMLNSNVLANSDFLTGAFPAEYGNAFSGVFDLKLRNGNNEKREYAFQAGFLGIDASFEGPFKRKQEIQLPNASYLINYRYSTISLLESMGLQIARPNQVVPNFQDLAFKFHLPTAKLGVFSFYGLGGKSRTVDNFLRIVNDRPYELQEVDQYKMGLTGISNILNLSDNAYLETSASFSGTRYFYTYDGVFNDQRYREQYEDYVNTSFRLASIYSTKINSRHSNKAGFIYTNLGYKLESEGHLNDGSLKYQVNEQGDFGMIQAFASHRVNITDRFTITGGMHFLMLGLNKDSSLEPRIGLNWQFKPNQWFSLAYGKHSRREETSLYFTELAREDQSTYQPNKELGLAKAHHFVVGYDRNFNGNMHLKLEAYYQHLYQIPIDETPLSTFSSLNQQDAFQRVALVNEGKGRNYGLELTLEKFMSEGFFFLMTGSLYNSNYKTLTEELYNTRYNGRYSANLVAGKEFKINSNKRDRLLNVGFENVLGGGARVDEIDLEASRQEARTVYYANTPFNRQLKDHFRIDFQVSLKTNRAKLTHELRVDIQNLTSRTNPIAESYSVSQDRIVTSAYTGEIIPVLSYKVIF